MVQSEVMRTLHDATFALLERTGVRIDSPAALDVLADYGVRVDRESQRVHPGEDDLTRALATAPRRVTVHGRGPAEPVALGGDGSYILTGGSSLRVLTLEGQVETATWEHLRQFNVLLDALPHVHMCVNQVDPAEAGPDRLYRLLAAEMLIDMPKPLLLQAANARDVERIIEMGCAVCGSAEALRERPPFMIGCNAEPPLYIPRDVAELAVAACRAGLPFSLGNYNMMGITAPLTAAGSTVQLNAVQVVAIILAQAARPGAPVVYTAFSGGGDLRTLDVLAATPQTTQMVRMAAELGRTYGLPVYSTALTDARRPDEQAATEHAIQLEHALECGVHLVQGFTSMMDKMLLSSYVQAVIDDDIAAYVLAAHRRPDVSEESLALEAMHDVATLPEYHDLKFAAHAHTVAHLREDRWQPLAFAYENGLSWSRRGSPSLVERATASAREILARHTPAAIAPELAAELRRIAAA